MNTSLPSRQQRRANERRAKKQAGRTVHVETLTRAEALARGEAVCPCCPDAGVRITTETCPVETDGQEPTPEDRAWADRAMIELVDLGLVEEVDTAGDGGKVYSPTESGQRIACRMLGIDPDWWEAFHRDRD